MADIPRGTWVPVDEHADATAIANAIHRDAIPEEERGYFLALIHNHIATCAICAEELKERL